MKLLSHSPIFVSTLLWLLLGSFALAEAQQEQKTSLRGGYPAVSSPSIHNGRQLTASESPDFWAQIWLVARRLWPVSTAISAEEKQQLLAMVAMYYATNGAKWANKDSWLSFTSSACEWYNQADNICDEAGLLQQLQLTENGLVGTLSDSIGELVNLEELNLSDNEGLTGSLPASIVQLVNLATLDLRATGLVGEIPEPLCGIRNLLFDCDSTGAGLCGCDCACSL